VTGGGEADALLNTDPLALLVGMVLDQQVPLEWAFAGPATLRDRLGTLDATAIAARPVDDVVAAAFARPAVHRFPAAMARRIHELCVVVRDRYGGDAAQVWTAAGDGADLLARLRALPGFGDEKARITVAVLAKRFAVRPPGWEAAAGVFADDEPRSVADCGSPEGLARVRAWKQAQRAAGRDKQGRPVAGVRPAPAPAPPAPARGRRRAAR
jgi:uncharacterized HhH-GPD family protein